MPCRYDQQAGRTAALMLGSMLPVAGDVVLVSGRADYAAHRLRIEGFQAVLAERFPHLRLREIIAGRRARAHQPAAGENAGRIAADCRLVQYRHGQHADSRSAGAPPAVRQGGVTHELYQTTRELLAKRVLTLTLDQNTLRHAQLALTLLRHLEEGEQPETHHPGKVDFMLFTQENFA